MNWVGGWRSRVLRSSDSRKQKEFFEKKRLQNRQNLLAPPPPPATPKNGNVGNMDLLTMFIVNQIALKKDHASNAKITHLPKSKGNPNSMGGQSLELPMSPCSPSRLSLAESESHHSAQAPGLKKRKPSFLDELKFKTLSPLLETNLSDHSTSVSQHLVRGSVGSFSSASQSSLEALNFQTRPTVNISPSPPPAKLHRTKTALPVGLCEYSPWTVPYQTSQTSFADGVQFESTLHRSDSSGPSIHSDENPFNGLEMNDQEEKPHIFGRNNGAEDSSGKRTTKHHFQKEAPHLPTGAHFSAFIESSNNDRSTDFLSQHMSRCVDSRPGRVHSNVSEHAWESPVTCSYREGYDVTNSLPSLTYGLEKGLRQDDDTYNYLCHSKDILSTSQSCPSGTSVPARVMCDPEQRGRVSKPHGSLQTLRQINHKPNSELSEDQFVPSCLMTKTESSKMHKKTSSKTQDKSTQTAGFSSLTSQDASVQCCLSKATRMSGFTKPTTHLHHSRKHKASATRRQTHHGSKHADPNQVAASDIPKVEQNTSCMMAKQHPTKQGPETIMRYERLSESESQPCMKNQPLLHPFHINAPELKEQPVENMVLRRERCEGHEESVNQNPAVNSSCAEEPNPTFNAETGGHRESGGSLKEIAAILLMLKQKNKH